MVKSARRRNAKKTVDRKKRGTKGYRRKTMRKRQKGGMPPSAPPPPPSPEKLHKFTNQLPTRAVSAPPYLEKLPYLEKPTSDSDTESENSFTTSPPESPTRSVKHNQQTEEVKYTITKKGDSWLVTIFIDGTNDTYIVPDDILSKVRLFVRKTAVG